MRPMCRRYTSMLQSNITIYYFLDKYVYIYFFLSVLMAIEVFKIV